MVVLPIHPPWYVLCVQSIATYPFESSSFVIPELTATESKHLKITPLPFVHALLLQGLDNLHAAQPYAKAQPLGNRKNLQG